MKPELKFSLLLASQSPRRRQLLEAAGFAFRTISPSVNEAFPNKGEADRISLENAVLKARSLEAQARDGEIVLGSDTLVVLDDHAIGKPKDRDDAMRILGRLSGKTHTVVSGLHLRSSKWGERSAVAKSRVTFRPITSKEIESYTLLKEPYDKAGAYAVQGVSGLFIKSIEGSFSNVMGLPLELLLEELAALTQVSVFDLLEKA